MQMAPERVEQIQQALIGAGDLHGAPTGRWDAETRDAMSRYQAENGFGVTGLPDAKSLMKLGLGPHPLPESLNPSRAAANTPSAEDDPPPSSESAAPSDPPPSPTPPDVH
jgi:peptidoglycan hydrolase-like protein with peptidoglycan-binding domain